MKYRIGDRFTYTDHKSFHCQLVDITSTRLTKYPYIISWDSSWAKLNYAKEFNKEMMLMLKKTTPVIKLPDELFVL